MPRRRSKVKIEQRVDRHDGTIDGEDAEHEHAVAHDEGHEGDVAPAAAAVFDEHEGEDEHLGEEG